MALTFKQMRDEALDNVAKSGALTLQSSTLLSTRMGTWVNRAQLWIDRKVDTLQFNLTSVTVANQQSYALPADLRRVFTLRLIDGLNSRKLTPVLPWEIDRRIPSFSSNTTGISSFYVPYQDTLTFELFPIPDQAYTLQLRCSKYPADMVADNDTSTLIGCDDAIVAFATMFAFRWIQELKDANEWEAYGIRIVKELKENSDDAQRYVDWEPLMEGFSVTRNNYVGDYVNNPFIIGNSLDNWWR